MRVRKRSVGVRPRTIKYQLHSAVITRLDPEGTFIGGEGFPFTLTSGMLNANFEPAQVDWMAPIVLGEGSTFSMEFEVKNVNPDFWDIMAGGEVRGEARRAVKEAHFAKVYGIGPSSIQRQVEEARHQNPWLKDPWLIRLGRRLCGA